jgi:hypothetical protein
MAPTPAATTVSNQIEKIVLEIEKGRIIRPPANYVQVLCMVMHEAIEQRKTWPEGAPVSADKKRKDFLERIVGVSSFKDMPEKYRHAFWAWAMPWTHSETRHWHMNGETALWLRLVLQSLYAPEPFTEGASEGASA